MRENRPIGGGLQGGQHVVPSGGYVVARATRGPGLGTRLLSLAGAVWLARRLDRTVVVDWRGSAYLENPALDYFAELFEPVSDFLGVPFRQLPGAPDHRGAPDDAKAKLHASECRALLAGERPIPKFLISAGVYTLEDLDPFGDPVEHHEFLKAFYGQIRPRAEIAEALEAWYEAHLRGHALIGLNVSTGNGSFGPDKKKGRGRVDTRPFENEQRFFDQLERACDLATQTLPAGSREQRKVFFATDSTATAELLGRLPGAITRRRVFPPAGVGRRFAEYRKLGYSDRAAAADTLIDMFLLARCHAMIRNESKFSGFALVSTDYFGGNVFDLEGTRHSFDALRLSVRGKGRIESPPTSNQRRGGSVERPAA